jgi:hypothetical protein
VLLALLAAAAAANLYRPQLVGKAGLARAAGSLLLGAALLLVANFAVAGRLAWTEGGATFAFARMLQDGIVDRYLADHCPDRRLHLCRFRDRLPDTADDFLWHEGNSGAFHALGGFDDKRGEMAKLARQSLTLYPDLHVATALRSGLRQLVMVRTGDGIAPDVWLAYGVIEKLAPEAVPASHSARQRMGFLRFGAINWLHVPVALGSLAALPLILFFGLRWKEFGDLVPLAATAGAAILANAFVCGVLSGPHDRYGARILWIATFALALAVMRLMATMRLVAPAPVLQPSYARRTPPDAA